MNNIKPKPMWSISIGVLLHLHAEMKGIVPSWTSLPGLA